MEYIIETKNLTKTFPNKLAVDHIKRLKKIDVVSSNPTSSEKTQKDSSKLQHFCPSFKMNNNSFC